jgi:hypothetical protein
MFINSLGEKIPGKIHWFMGLLQVSLIIIKMAQNGRGMRIADIPEKHEFLEYNRYDKT